MARHTLLRSTARRLLTKAQSVPFAQIEKAEWKFYIDYIQPGMTVLDVGANIGELTLLFAHFARQEGRVHSFEPTPSTYARLKALTLSHSNVTVVQKAVTDHSGTAALHIYDEEHSSWNTLADRSLEQYGIGSTNVMTAEVITTTVDDYCRDNLIEQVHLLKIDVEGYETQVIEGAQQTLDEIDAALARIDDGTYGTCQVCGKQIGADRLRAIPWARLCIDDQRRAG